MKEPLVSRILRYALYVAFALGIVGVITLPFMLRYYYLLFYGSVSAMPPDTTFIRTFLMGVGAIGLWVVLEMIWMLRSIPKGPFITRNVRALNRMGVILLVLAVAFFGKCMLYLTFATLLCGVVLLAGGLFAFTLAELIRQAVAFREENDLTI